MNDSTKPHSAINPYSSRSLTAEAPSTITLRPTGVTVVAVLSILGGILGALSGLMQLVQHLAQNLATAFLPAGQAGDAQRQWFAEIQEVNSRFLIPNLAVGAMTIVLGLCLLIGGIGLLQPKSWSRTFLRKTFLAAIAFEVVRMIYYVVLQIALFPVMQRQFEAMGSDAGPGNPLANSETFQTMQTTFMVIGFAFALLWFLIKLAAYFWGRSYLNRDHVKAYCNQSLAA